eukprot:7391919-Prymnesium_polylepis.4
MPASLRFIERVEQYATPRRGLRRFRVRQVCARRQQRDALPPPGRLPVEQRLGGAIADLDAQDAQVGPPAVIEAVQHARKRHAAAHRDHDPLDARRDVANLLADGLQVLLTLDAEGNVLPPSHRRVRVRPRCNLAEEADVVLDERGAVRVRVLLLGAERLGARHVDAARHAHVRADTRHAAKHGRVSAGFDHDTHAFALRVLRDREHRSRLAAASSVDRESIVALRPSVADLLDRRDCSWVGHAARRLLLESDQLGNGGLERDQVERRDPLLGVTHAHAQIPRLARRLDRVALRLGRHRSVQLQLVRGRIHAFPIHIEEHVEELLGALRASALRARADRAVRAAPLATQLGRGIEQGPRPADVHAAAVGARDLDLRSLQHEPLVLHRGPQRLARRLDHAREELGAILVRERCKAAHGGLRYGEGGGRFDLLALLALSCTCSRLARIHWTEVKLLRPLDGEHLSLARNDEVLVRRDELAALR